MSKVKKLTKAEHLEMELNQEQVRIATLEKELLLEKKANKLLKDKIAELESQRVIQAMNNRLDTLKRKEEAVKEEVKKYTNKIKEKYKLKEGFGINPDTGEIEEE